MDDGSHFWDPSLFIGLLLLRDCWLTPLQNCSFTHITLFDLD
ncbi:unnamed protein product [Brassica rapa subsp. trilocularis]